MIALRYSRHAVSALATVSALCACGGAQALHVAPASYSASASIAQPLGSYKSMYSFQIKPDGQMPEAPLLSFNGMLYGTTSAGGSGCQESGCGTIFSISNDGVEKVLHRFAAASDGASPLAPLTVGKSALYGTTYSGGVNCGKNPKGGASGCGIVFSVTPAGRERVLYRFGNNPDGAHPKGSVTDVNGTLYGTTLSGGARCLGIRLGCGTVYSVDSSGRERVLHRFTGKPDGAQPTGNLLYLRGMLFGTTSYGGACNRGAIFEITLSGRERVLYSPGCTTVNISNPSGLVSLHGDLYGASQQGGTRNRGALYTITPQGEEHVLHSFAGSWDGEGPIGLAIAANGTLYGTAEGGLGYGTIYQVSSSGVFQVLYRFKGVPDGNSPFAGLTDVKGTLYGTTYQGGSGCHYQYCQNGFGTVFRITP